MPVTALTGQNVAVRCDVGTLSLRNIPPRSKEAVQRAFWTAITTSEESGALAVQIADPAENEG